MADQNHKLNQTSTWVSLYIYINLEELGQSWSKACVKRTCSALYEFTILPFKHDRFLQSNMPYSLVLTLPQLFVPNEFPKHLSELDALLFWKHFKLRKISCLNVVVEEKVPKT